MLPPSQAQRWQPSHHPGLPATHAGPPLPCPAVGGGHARPTRMARLAMHACGFAQPPAGPKAGRQLISSPRCLSGNGSYTVLLALAGRQHQALSNLEQEQVRTGSPGPTPGGPAALPGLGT